MRIGILLAPAKRPAPMLAIRSALLVTLLLATSAQAQSLDGPESVDFDRSNQRQVISNKGANEILVRDGGGVISLLTALPGGGSPHGLRVVGDNLWVAHGSTVRGFDATTGATLGSVSISGASFLNGMATDGRRLWVSDFSTRRIHAIDISDPSNPSDSLIGTAPGTPNGLEYERSRERLLIAGWGSNAKVYELRLAPGASVSQIVSTSSSNFDGVAIDCAGNVYVSSWGSSALLRFDAPLTAASVATTFAPGLSQPSDIRYVRAGGYILSPNFGADTVTTHQTGCLFDDSME